MINKSKVTWTEMIRTKNYSRTVRYGIAICLVFVPLYLISKWAAVAMLLGLDIYLLFRSRCIKTPFVSIIFLTLVILQFAITLRIFFFEVYSVPTGSMQSLLYPGDKIIVNKTCYGPYVPASLGDIPWLNLFARNTTETTQKEPIEKNRLTGWSELKRNDVVVLENPDVKGEFLVKRCIALPNDTLQAKNSVLFINLQKEPTLGTRQSNFQITFGNIKQFVKLAQLTSVSFSILRLVGTHGSAQVLLTSKQLYRFRTSKSIGTIKLIVNTTPFFTKTGSFNWTFDNFGPLVIPGRNVRVRLNSVTYVIYRGIIERELGCKLSVRGNKFFIMEKEITGYRFKKDYCFVMGDNRSMSADSRILGFISQDAIVGKATLSFRTQNFQFSTL